MSVHQVLSLTSIAVAITILHTSCFTGINATMSPILIVHGYTDSRLYVQDNSDTDCNTNGETIRIWINVTHVTTAPTCILKQFTLNNTNNHFFDAEDVTVSAENFGSINSIANFSDILGTNPTDGMINYFIDRGYTVDVNLRAAPYDWRLAAEQLRDRGYYSNVKQLIEQMYEDNGNTKVTLVAFSMGGPVSLYFLTQVVNQEWKDMYIHAYIPLAAAWSGVSDFLQLVLTPPADNSFLALIPINATTDEILLVYRSILSHHWLLPRASAFNDITLVSTSTRNYTSRDYQQLFMDAGYPQGYTKLSQNDLDVPSPNVPTYCFYGSGLQTPLTYFYEDGFPDSRPRVTFGDGDEIVNIESLEVCQNWADSGYSFNRTVFPGVDHFEILSHEAVLNAIGKVVEDQMNSAGRLSALSSLSGLMIVVIMNFMF